MNLEKRLNGLEEKLSINVSPEQAAHNKKLRRWIGEARKRTDARRAQEGLEPINWAIEDDYVSQGGSIAEMLRAARERREAKEGINRTVQR